MHQNLLPNNNDAQSTTKYGFLLRPDAQIVALRAHCTRTALKAPPRGPSVRPMYKQKRRTWNTTQIMWPYTGVDNQSCTCEQARIIQSNGFLLKGKRGIRYSKRSAQRPRRCSEPNQAEMDTAGTEESVHRGGMGNSPRRDVTDRSKWY